MADQHNRDASDSHTEADFAAAMKELQRGEQTAAALEGHLDSLEAKIEALLAQADKAEQELKTHASTASDKTAPDANKGASSSQ